METKMKIVFLSISFASLISILVSDSSQLYVYSGNVTENESILTGKLEVLTKVYNPHYCVGSNNTESGLSYLDLNETHPADRNGKSIPCIEPNDLSIQVVTSENGILKEMVSFSGANEERIVEMLIGTVYDVKVARNFLGPFEPEYSSQCQSKIVLQVVQLCTISIRYQDPVLN
jgi:hypothetical protein